MRWPTAAIRRTARANSPESVGEDTFAATTVVSTRIRLVRSTLACGLGQQRLIEPVHRADPQRVVSFIGVVACGTDPSSGIRRTAAR